jgi:hypothetical protein
LGLVLGVLTLIIKKWFKKNMDININRAYRNLILVIGFILVGIVVTLIVNADLLSKTEENRKRLQRAPLVTDVDKLDTQEFIPVEKPVTVADIPADLVGLVTPEYKDAPLPVKSKKSNLIIENLLFAMKFYARVPQEDELAVSVSGWDPNTGHYLPDTGFGGSPIIALARNARYLLVLKLYQDYFPSTHYFDDDAQRIEAILERIIEPERLQGLISSESFYQVRVPDKIFYDLMWLSEVTGKEKYRDAAFFIADKHSNTVIRQSIAIKNNRDRTSKIGMINDAAMSYIAGVEMGKLDLQEDARLVMNEMIKELYAESFNLIYTSASIGPFGNITTTFITNDQMHALSGMVRYAAASGDSEVESLAYRILESLADGTNPICDQTHHGFFRRYNGDSRSPHKDFKLADDHIIFLEAWIKLNILKDGKYDDILNYYYEFFETLLYDAYSNAIYFTYEIDWDPFKESNNRPIVSVDSILDFILLTLEDKKFRVDKSIGSV